MLTSYIGFELITEKIVTITEAVTKTETLETPILNIDMFITLAIAVLALGIGNFLRKRLSFLTKFCIPAPVIGGLLLAILFCVFYSTGFVEINFDETLKNVCMYMFFTSVGFQASLSTLKKGGLGLVLIIIVSTVLIVLQNLTGVGLGNLIGAGSLLGMTTGSIPLVGGHGTAGAFGPILEDAGLASATTLCTAAATFGLVSGSLMGGPLARRLIEKKDLLKTAVPVETVSRKKKDSEKNAKNESYASAVFMIVISVGIGSIISHFFDAAGITFPGYIGGMLVAAILRNVSEKLKWFDIPMEAIDDVGSISLSLFLGIAMITLKLWQLADVGVVLLILLAAQTIVMYLFARFVVFNVMGRDYDAAVITAGCVGFGMGATANAMANMEAVTKKYAPSTKAFILVPLVGALFIDFANSLIITSFINFIK